MYVCGWVCMQASYSIELTPHEKDSPELTPPPQTWIVIIILDSFLINSTLQYNNNFKWWGGGVEVHVIWNVLINWRCYFKWFNLFNLYKSCLLNFVIMGGFDGAQNEILWFSVNLKVLGCIVDVLSPVQYNFSIFRLCL